MTSHINNNLEKLNFKSILSKCQKSNDYLNVLMFATKLAESETKKIIESEEN